MLRASREAGCKIALLKYKMGAPNLSNEEKQKILKDLKEIATSTNPIGGRYDPQRECSKKFWKTFIVKNCLCCYFTGCNYCL